MCKGKIQCGQAVKAIFRRSQILTTIAALDMTPAGLFPPPLIYIHSHLGWADHDYHNSLPSNCIATHLIREQHIIWYGL